VGQQRMPKQLAHAAGEEAVLEGCFLEVGGNASGHPDYLRRLQRERAESPAEVYTFGLPKLRVRGLLKGQPAGQLMGRVKVHCQQTGLTASLVFHPFDADAATSLHSLVSGSIRRSAGVDIDPVKPGELVRLLLGTTDERVLMAPVGCCAAAVANESADRSVGALHRAGVLYDDADHFPRAGTVAGSSSGVGAYQPPTDFAAVGHNSLSLGRALTSPGSMMTPRLWHAVVDSVHAADLGEPGNTAKSSALRPLSAPAAEKQSRGASMCYEKAVLLATKLPDDAPPPLPRKWKPAPAATK